MSYRVLNTLTNDFDYTHIVLMYDIRPVIFSYEHLFYRLIKTRYFISINQSVESIFL